jgi:hypothetical protein
MKKKNFVTLQKHRQVKKHLKRKQVNSIKSIMNNLDFIMAQYSLKNVLSY